jgi:DNA repair photolyase
MAEYYHVDNFTTHIRIKENAPKILRRELNKLGFTSKSELETETLWSFLDKDDATRLAQKFPRKIIVGVSGGVSDAYQPAEKEYKITQQVLEVLLDFGLPVFILTKSNLVLRDLDLLKEIHEKSFVNVDFSITLHDEKTKKIIEPKSSATWERFDALKEIRQAGLFGGVMAMPMIPTIGDTWENMEALAKDAKRVGAEFILFSGMTLKPGKEKNYFLNVIKNNFPDHLQAIKKIYSNDNKYGQPIFKYLPVNVMLQGYAICKKVGISDRSIRHKVPYEHEINNLVFNRILDIAWRMSMMLGMRGSKPYYELAAKLEKGVENLKTLQDEGTLSEVLFLDEQMTQVVEEIMETGTCQVLIDIEQKLDTICLDEFEVEVKAAPDMY